MQQKKYLWSLYLIIATIVISLAVQVYFNFKNYQINKQSFINQVQSSLDTATDNYYVDLAKNKHPLFSNKIRSKVLVSNGKKNNWINDNNENDNISIIIKSVDFVHDTNTVSKDIKRLSENNLPKKHAKQIKIEDSIFDNFFHSNRFIKNGKHHQTLKGDNFFLTSVSDSLDVNLITSLKSIYFSMTNDSLDFKRLNLLLKKELDRKNITLPYQLNHYNNKNLISSNDSIRFGKNVIKTLAKSTYLNKDEKIELLFPNQTKTILKKGLVGILLSLFLAIAIISSLFYLLNIIKKQKQIAEIKNDFISNITHEFKTPITTIGLAVESIKTFNTNNNAKAEEYLDITKGQLDKLNVMVEKILETAVLDSKELLLNKENIDIVNLIEKCIAKHKIIQQTKTLSFKTTTKELFLNIDIFHFENAISNLIGNAIKYGGDNIEIQLIATENNLEISVSDNGIIPKNQKEKIFDKFYRIPKGNTHDVKGFGIGLYYTKKIIEKHKGTLELMNTKNTVFQIKLPLVS